MGNLFYGGLMAARQTRANLEQASQLKNVHQTTAFLRSDLAEIKEQVERLAMLNQAMWELVSERLRLTEADLERKAQEVDMRDGKADGKMSTHPLRCPKCGRVSNSRHKKCLYCGLLFEGSTFG